MLRAIERGIGESIGVRSGELGGDSAFPMRRLRMMRRMRKTMPIKRAMDPTPIATALIMTVVLLACTLFWEAVTPVPFMGLPSTSVPPERVPALVPVVVVPRFATPAVGRLSAS